ncbi:MAG: DRTGG domain-containing protein [Candidatus Ranarchaeia archaeon]
MEAGDIAAPVESFVVGAMSPASALDHFTDAGEKAVILTGDRAEVALAALETSTALLIMTGNVEPNPRILETARAKGVPVILTGMSTFNVVARMSELTGKIKPEQAQKIAMAKTAIDTEVNWIKFLNDLPLKKNPIVKEYLGKVQTK